MSIAALPPIPAPPHDPTSMLVDRRLGWHLLEHSGAVLTGGRLALAPSPASQRPLTEPSGSFGGLRSPATTAWFAGDVWLLDPVNLRLLRFDPCTCAFEAVPCFAGSGSGPRELGEPSAIAVSSGHLYVSDRGNARIADFLVPSMGLSGLWRAPIAWRPGGIVAAPSGRVHVVDDLNGAVHTFSRRGSYVGRIDGVGASTHLMLGSDGATLFAAGALDAFRIDPDGTVTQLDDIHADGLADQVEPLPFAVDRAGAMQLGSTCWPVNGRWFGADGEPSVGIDERVAFQPSGSALLGPFDSGIDRCTWHRVILRGDLPAGTRVSVTTQTSDVELPVTHLAARPVETRLTSTAFDGGEWDGLITGAPGRFLWLRLELAGGGEASPALEQIELEFPRISLRRFMPAVYGHEPRSADFTDRLLSLFDRELRDIEGVVDNSASLFEPLSTPALDWLASWIGEQLPASLPERARRDLLDRAAQIAAVRGTRHGLWTMLVAFLGLEALVDVCQCGVEPGSCRQPVRKCPPAHPHRWSWSPPPLILEHYRLRRWFEAGAGRLGDQAVLWGRRIVNRSQLDAGARVGVTQLKGVPDPLHDPFLVYAHQFTVFVPAAAAPTPQRRHDIAKLIDRESPAHTKATIEFVEPRLRIGFQSSIGLDAVVARMPHGVTLGATPVGPASVLTGSTQARVPTARIGATSVIE